MIELQIQCKTQCKGIIPAIKYRLDPDLSLTVTQGDAVLGVVQNVIAAASDPGSIPEELGILRIEVIPLSETGMVVQRGTIF
ncbi:hypothetical protein SD70_02395 [Gordoniibacillus kamchatkensis]|uniref:Uncharacterized protein n=1 Tax=Gordoniibacillus kamchatkensis TaxID=1590651 RepID=A0ABR5ANE8_9BACL|nr:hypothetical protein [Paenibacillus sp. VKM B-2647]KIL42055.1 hypothetical protein SD70_02395 [Paenibacillus sp. VKM B-2647]